MVDVLNKVRDYLEAGARQVWIVAPRSNTVTISESPRKVRVLTEEDRLVGDGPVTGFACDVREVFSHDAT